MNSRTRTASTSCSALSATSNPSHLTNRDPRQATATAEAAWRLRHADRIFPGLASRARPHALAPSARDRCARHLRRSCDDAVLEQIFSTYTLARETAHVPNLHSH